MVSIRIIEKADIEGFYSALSGVVGERKYLRTLSPPSFSNVTDFVCKNIDNNAAQYVAEIKGKIVGWIDIVPIEIESMRHVGLLGMGVVAEHRGKGIGSELINKATNHAWDAGLKRIELEVFSNNAVAINLYKNNGFKIEGTKCNGRYLNGKYEDVHFMAQCRI
ncbi:GNAT family N-acetyltransferase [bacterium]|nr:GNAT family N-acetyltransferase [bacterium]